MEKTSKRIVFLGSAEFSLPVLRALTGEYTVVGVVTQPDRPAGRGRTLTAPPLKLLATELGLDVFQPPRLRAPEAMVQLHAWQPDVIIVAAYGQILRSEALELAPFGCVNVHGSLLPRWRGASPIQSAILHGDDASGVTIMRMDAGVDTGPMLAQRSTVILPDDNAASLGQRLAMLGAQLLLETLPGYLDGTLAATPQPEAGASYAPLLKKEDAELDFTQPALALERKVRAFAPWPGAYLNWQGAILKIHHAHVAAPPPDHQEAAPGQPVTLAGLPAFATTAGWLVLDEVQPAGKKAMPGAVFLRGVRGWA